VVILASPNTLGHSPKALIDLINQKRAGKTITPKERPATGNVVDLMEALRRSVGKEQPSRAYEEAEESGRRTKGDAAGDRR
jgi:DNA end-binding protein Ku